MSRFRVVFSSVRAAIGVGAVVAFSGCGDRTGPVVGHAFGVSRGGHSIVELVRAVYDSQPTGARLGVLTWDVPGGANLMQETEGANFFAANRNVIAVVGHNGSRNALIASMVYSDAHVAHLVPNATSRRLTTAGDWTFQLVPDDSAEGAYLASYAYDSLRAHRIAVLYVGDEYGTGLRDGVRSELAARGTDPPVDVTMVPNESCYSAQARSIQRLIVVAALRRGQPDVVVAATGMSNARCLADIIEAERPGTPILGADGFGFQTAPNAPVNPAVLQQVRFVRFWQPGADSVNRVFLDRWHRVSERPPNDVDALTYDGYMLLDAAVRAVGPSRLAVRTWLRSLGVTRAPFQGVTGPISFARGRVGLVLRMVPAQESAP